MTCEDLNFFLRTMVTYSTVVPVSVALRDPYPNCISLMPSLNSTNREQCCWNMFQLFITKPHNQTVISVQFSPDTMLLEHVSVVYNQVSQPNSYQAYFSPDTSIIISNSMCTVLTHFYEKCFLGR